MSKVYVVDEATGRFLFFGRREAFENSKGPKKEAARRKGVLYLDPNTAGKRPDDTRWNATANKWVPDPDLVNARVERDLYGPALRAYLLEGMLARAAEADAPAALKAWAASRA